MRNNSGISTLAFLLFCCFATQLAAQTTNTWKGGAPGHETDWSYFKNWSRGVAPNEFDRVVIPDVSSAGRHYPVIRTGEVEVLSVTVQSGAMLTLDNAARLLTTEWNCQGKCHGCAVRVWVEGEVPTTAEAPSGH